MIVRFIKRPDVGDERDLTRIAMTVKSVDYWPYLMNEFVRFMNAAGFIVTKQEIRDWADGL